MRVPTSQRMRHRTFALTEEQDLALAELSRRTGRDASSIVRAAVVRALKDWKEKQAP